ncbi:MAG: heavy metal translocating P-type ATPase [Lachnospiraceae bacterium]
MLVKKNSNHSHSREHECTCHTHENIHHKHNENCHEHANTHHKHSENCNDHTGGCGCEHGELTRNNVYWIAAGILLFLFACLPFLPSMLSTLMYWIAYLFIAYDILLLSLKNIRKGKVFDENFLMSIATLGALCIRKYPEAIAVMLLYKLGEYFQDKAVNQSRASIEGLMDLHPEEAHLITGMASMTTVAPETLKEGDIILVRPGEKIPVDGIILEGSSELNTAALTGESVPRYVTVNSEVLSGTINMSGKLTVRVTKPLAESTSTRILNIIQEAAEKKASTETFITRFARIYTPCVVLIAFLLTILPPFVFHIGTFSTWLYRGLSFLVVSCPCALVISVPLSFFGGIGLASKNGILVKGGNYLELLSQIDTVVFDKTGTLTTGSFVVSNLYPNLISAQELLLLAAYAESHSTHPIAQSILKANTEALDPSYVLEVTEQAGYGVSVKTKDGTIYAGNAKLMEQYNIPYQTIPSAYTMIYVAVDSGYAGAIEIADQIKSDSAATIASLKEFGILRQYLLTGDNQDCADAVAQSVGIPSAIGNLLPDEKLQAVETMYEQSGSKIAFLGDGINDAPVLARVDVGIAMGGVGSDAAIEAADVVLMNDEPSGLIQAIRIAKRTKCIVTENIAFSLGIKALILVLTALGISNMWMAVFADVGVALLAVANAGRLALCKASKPIR